jgi:hypothetical protein
MSAIERNRFRLPTWNDPYRVEGISNGRLIPARGPPHIPSTIILQSVFDHQSNAGADMMTGSGRTIDKRTVSPLVACLLLAACGGDDSTSGGGGGSTATVPGAPTIGSATAGNGSASIAFTAPASNGGSTITGYTATCAASGATTLTGTGTASPITVSSMTNGTTYSCSVTATNAVGTSAASAAVSVSPSEGSGSSTSTASVLCPSSGTYTGSYSSAGTLTSTWSWTCSGSTRTLAANGLPNHAVGTFPNSGNPNTIAAQTVSTSMTLNPALGSSTTTIGGPSGRVFYALNGVKFDADTAGTCPSTATSASNCNLANGTDTWKIEALGQDVFDFGEDSNNAHVQPGGTYHYHGMPEGLMTALGLSSASPRMQLVGWAADGFPIYARYCYTNATDASSAIKVCTGSYSLDSTADAGRPSTSWVPLGAFKSDWNYVAGSGDLDECNGRFGVTPEFPTGIYYYMTTDSYPYASRCARGSFT